MAEFPNLVAPPNSQAELLVRRVFGTVMRPAQGVPGVLYYREGPGYKWRKICSTLERPPFKARAAKGDLRKPLIPPGTYPISLSYSPAQSRSKADPTQDPRRPLLAGVQGYTGVQIHVGNTIEDSHGCLLTGTYAGAPVGKIIQSLDNFQKVRDLWRNADASLWPARITIDEVHMEENEETE
jgi:hypothetical protein